MPAVEPSLVSDYRPTKNTGAVFREAWGFKGDAVPRMLELAAGHPWIHACSGGAFIPGEDRRIDLYHPSGERIDVAELDKHVQDAGTIFIDPPYGQKVWDLAFRQSVVNAAMRALRPGGRLIVHSPWQPKFNRVAKRVGKVYFRDDTNLGFPDALILICAYEKQAGFLDGTTRRKKDQKRRGKVAATGPKPRCNCREYDEATLCPVHSPED